MDLLLVSILTGLTTVVGVMLALFYGQPSRKVLAFYLGLSAGIMMLVIFLDLLPAAFAEGTVQSVGIGLGLGLVMMLIIYEGIHQRLERMSISTDPKQNEYLRTGLSISIAIGVHHIPEGIAVGAGFESHHQLGLIIALSIALHHIPEGIGLAIPLLLSGMKKRWILMISFGICLCLPLGAILGKLFFVDSSFMVSVGMAFASGAMGYIVWKEILPLSFKHDGPSARWGITLSLACIFLIKVLR